MPFDRFSPFGIWGFTAATSPCELVFDALVDSNGDATSGPVAIAVSYAMAMGLGVASLQFQKANEQRNGDTCTDLLSDMEHNYLLYPSATASMFERQEALSSAQSAIEGATHGAIDSALTAALGSYYISHDTVETPVFYKASYDVSPPETPVKLVQITEYILPGSQIVSYTRIRDDGNALVVGDILTISPIGRHEVVTVTSVGAGTFTATFALTHESGDYATTQSIPVWNSTARHYVIFVTTAALSDNEALARANLAMRRLVPSVSTWAITDPDTVDPTISRPWTVGGGLIGLTPLGTVTLPT